MKINGLQWGGVEPSSSSEQEQDSCCSDTSSSTPDSTLYKTILRAENGDSLFLKASQSDDFPSVDKEDDSTPLTRGTLVSSISSFGVSASVYSSSQSYTSNPCGNYFYKQQVTAGTPTSYFWPTSAYRLSFYAYYPYGNSAFTVSSSASTNGIPTYAYTVPSSISAQQDVMTAQVTNKACGSPQTPVSLSFNHHTSAIKVKYTNDGASAVTITGISITGVKYSGTLNNGTWTLGSAVNSSTSNPFSLSLSTNVAAGATVDLTGTSNIFLMLPQTIPSGAKLTITTSDNSYECDLSGSWVAGKSYTYHISVEDAYDYYLSVETPDDIDLAGGSKDYKILSYKEDANGVQKAVAWTAQYSTDGGSTWTTTRPSWITTFTASGSGSISAYMAYTVTASANTSSTRTPTEQLKANTAVSNYDLSLHDVQGNTTTRNTANCYMVHAPGTYKLPLVYGNAIKNGSTNSSAYDPSGTSKKTFLKPFLNHVGSGITDPWLKNNSATPDGASLIWQDVKGLISAVDIDGDYLTFEITSDAIAEGNAVIAATQSGTVVWSWHIWVTNETFSNLTTVATGSHTYTVTPINLGWVNTSTRVPASGYSIRTCMIKVTQSESDGEEKTFTITQNNFSTTGYNTYYQWGRKDAEIPSNVARDSDHAAYNISGSSVSNVYSASSVTIGTAIQNPLTHYCNSSTYGPYSTAQNNLWDATKTTLGVGTNATVKTIYDPCPPGFCVPTANLYSYLASNPSYSTWDGTSGQAGRTWTKDTPNLFFPASGYRNYSSADLCEVDSYAHCWSASPYSTYGGYYLVNSSSGINNIPANRAYGFSVRPVVEE